MMNKGTAVVGFFVSFLCGMGLMWGIARDQGITPSKEVAQATAKGAGGHAAAAVPVFDDDPAWGNPDAPVTIVEISDFECPFCSRVNPTMARIKKDYGKEKVRIVWKHNPLPFHKRARPAHEAAQTVHALGGDFWKFHDLAFQNQKQLTPENLQKWAVAAGVDAAKFKAAFDAKKYASKIDKDLAMARKIGARGTPNFRINGKELSGARPFEQFKAAIDAELAEAQKLTSKGIAKSAVYVERAKANFKAPAPAQKPKEDKTVWKIPVFDTDPVKGAKDALVTIVEWSDFQCPFCSRVNPTMKKVMEEYPKDVRIVWKDNALPFHKRAKPAAYLARFAFDKQGHDGFWKAHDALFASQKNLEDAGLEAVAKKLGLNWKRVKSAIDSGKYAAKIEESMDLAADFQARGTPHFFINGRRLSGAQPFPKFKELIDKQLAVAKGLEKKGVPRAKIYRELMKTAKAPPQPEKRPVPEPSKDNAFKGPANAKVVIQEFSDFQCPYCNRVNPTVAQLLKKYPKDVKIVWRNFPLAFHKDAPLASEAAQEALAQGGNKAFWAFHDKLFQNQKQIKRPELEKYAQELGLDMARFKSALDTHKHKARVDGDMAAGKKAGVTGTPAFTVNGYFLSGAQPFSAFDKLVKLALKE